MIVEFESMRLGGQEGYKPLPAKTDTICQLKAPENVSEVHSLSGLLDGFACPEEESLGRVPGK